MVRFVTVGFARINVEQITQIQVCRINATSTATTLDEMAFVVFLTGGSRVTLMANTPDVGELLYQVGLSTNPAEWLTKCQDMALPVLSNLLANG